MIAYDTVISYSLIMFENSFVASFMPLYITLNMSYDSKSCQNIIKIHMIFNQYNHKGLMATSHELMQSACQRGYSYICMYIGK